MLMISIFHNELIKKEINMLNKNKSTIKSMIFSGLLAFGIMGVNDGFAIEFSDNQKNADKELKAFYDSKPHRLLMRQIYQYPSSGLKTISIRHCGLDEVHSFFEQNNIPVGEIINNAHAWSNYGSGGIPTASEIYIIVTPEAYDLFRKNEKTLRENYIRKHLDKQFLK